MRSILALLAVTFAFVLLCFALRTPTLFVQRESFGFLEWAGAIGNQPFYWGQILGRNIPRHPVWLNHLVVASATFQVMGLLQIAAMLSYRRLARVRDFTQQASESTYDTWLQRTMRKHWDLLLSAVVFAGLLPIATTCIPVRRWLLDLAPQIGTVFYSVGVVIVKKGGPFSGPWSAQMNWAWQYAPVFVPLTVSFWLSLAVAQSASRWKTRMQVSGPQARELPPSNSGLPSSARG